MRAVRISAPESDREDYEAIVTAARLFYVDGLTQEKVAKELGLSQSSVSRLLERDCKGAHRTPTPAQIGS